MKQRIWHFTGQYAINLINNSVPIWITNYVLMGYGTGAVMGVLPIIKETLNLQRNMEFPLESLSNPKTAINSQMKI